MNALKPKKCKSCQSEYQPRNSLQRACSARCALVLIRAIEGKRILRVRRQTLRKGMERLMTRSDHLRRAQAAFNAWVRARDAGLPCISCGTTESPYWDAGHFRTTAAAPELRFHPDNASLQCRKCNAYMGGNIVRYRANLIKRIGLSRVEWLEGPHPPKKYTVDEIKAIASKYRKMAREAAA